MQNDKQNRAPSKNELIHFQGYKEKVIEAVREIELAWKFVIENLRWIDKY